MQIKGFIGTSLIDFPGRISSVLFTGGCNFRCPFCHNSDLVLNLDKLPTITEKEAIEKLKKRKNFIDGVNITGGEPLINDSLSSFLRKIRELKLQIKVDTNGYFPGRLSKLLDSGIIDFIAMDVKAPPSKYNEAAGKQIDLSRIKESIKIIKNKSPEYEFRTTVVPDILEKKDFKNIGKMIQGAEKFILQQFRPTKTIDPEYLKKKPYSKQFIEEVSSLVKDYVKEIEIRI